MPSTGIDAEVDDATAGSSAALVMLDSSREALPSKEEVAAAHGLIWPSATVDTDMSVSDALARADKKLTLRCVRAMLQAFGFNVPASPTKGSLLQQLVHMILWLDLDAFQKKKRGCIKPSLSAAQLKEAAKIWRAHHPMIERRRLADLQENLPYPVLWQNLKRETLTAAGLHVVQAPSRRRLFLLCTCRW